MIISAGDKSRFAIESGITRAYARESFRALGYFVIFVDGYRYGVQAPDATMLACSFDKVGERIAHRGSHTARFAALSDAGVIADAFRDAIYAPNTEDHEFFGMSQPEFCDLIHSQHLNWTPDGDETFDDSSYILQFDVEDRVRLIAFKASELGYHHEPSTLKDLWLGADEFYKILEQWREAFARAWAGAVKISTADDGAEEQDCKGPP